jgi:hypothetical protein
MTRDEANGASATESCMTVQSPLDVQSVSYNWAAYERLKDYCILANGNADRRTSALEKAAAYEYGSAINLDYPGLQIVFESPTSGAPVFLIPKFLSDKECDRFVQRCSPEALKASATGDQTAFRRSKHVNIVKEETTGFHARVAELTNRRVANMEEVKVISYQKGGKFDVHMDTYGYDTAAFWMGLTSLDGGSLPDHTNRELTLFVYLNTVTHGGETAFYGPDYKNSALVETFRIRPTKGLGVLFYTSLQPPSGQLPPDLSAFDFQENHTPGSMPGVPYFWSVRDYYSLHAGLPAIDEKYILTQWIWPPNVDRDAIDPQDHTRQNVPNRTGGLIMSCAGRSGAEPELNRRALLTAAAGFSAQPLLPASAIAALSQLPSLGLGTCCDDY